MRSRLRKRMAAGVGVSTSCYRRASSRRFVEIGLEKCLKELAKEDTYAAEEGTLPRRLRDYIETASS